MTNDEADWLSDFLEAAQLSAKQSQVAASKDYAFKAKLLESRFARAKSLDADQTLAKLVAAAEALSGRGTFDAALDKLDEASSVARRLIETAPVEEPIEEPAAPEPLAAPAPPAAAKPVEIPEAEPLKAAPAEEPPTAEEEPSDLASLDTTAVVIAPETETEPAEAPAEEEDPWATLSSEEPSVEPSEAQTEPAAAPADEEDPWATLSTEAPAVESAEAQAEPAPAAEPIEEEDPWASLGTEEPSTESAETNIESAEDHPTERKAHGEESV